MSLLKQIPVGTRFGHLVTVSEAYGRKSPVTGKPAGYVKCRCDCGSPVVEIIAYDRPVLVKNLLNGDSKSCGCATDHFAYRGLSKQHLALYKCWTNMRERCLNPRNVAYRFYGGKGVTVCGEWRDAVTGFPAFVTWAKDQAYEPGLTIDRIDPDGNYEPGNCRWLTARENRLRAGRILDDEDEHRMTALRARTGQSIADIVELALDAFLPPLESTPGFRETGASSLPPGSFGKQNRETIAFREARTAARLRAVERAYQAAINNEGIPALDLSQLRHSTGKAVAHELELE